MSMQEYEIKCLQRESHQLEEESRKESLQENLQFIKAMDVVLKEVDFTVRQFNKHEERENGEVASRVYREIRTAIVGLKYRAESNLPSDHPQCKI